MAFETWLLFLVASVGLSLTPGPNGLLSLTHGVIYGSRRTLFTVSGGVLGFALLMALSMAGLGALIATSEQVFTAVKWLGALYLVYLGVKIWRSPPVPVHTANQNEADSAIASRYLFSKGFMVATSNPKVIIFFTAFLPQFINPLMPQWSQFLVMAVTFCVIEFITEMSLAAGAQRILPWLGIGKNIKIFHRVSGGTFIGAGVLLATIERS